ncbi:hypothetical protein [Labedaea rhizosphaerae]|uniref:DUF4878 domain-containing protein n=1 Tax=Labedaea rhizosphaerae TaxID=598644 RepID=A0A4R6RYE2_LABRH|nr:hypothetical protein [Labedaea rhizosphaerae]TDP92169.1 hypothetical protein EV186_108382 [Labedaea rhizosphaerae]
MTYPQQPGQWGQDPQSGPNQQPQWGQQQPPQYGQPSPPYGQPAQPQQPQYGGDYGQSHQYGQTQQFGQLPWDQQQTGGGLPPGGPKKRNPNTIAAIVVAAIVLVGGAGVGIYFATKGDDKGGNASPGTSTSSSAPATTTTESSTSDPYPTDTTTDDPYDTTTTEDSGGDTSGPAAAAQKFADGVNNRVRSDIIDASCDKDTPFANLADDSMDASVEIKGEPSLSGSTKAYVPVNIRFSGKDHELSMPLDKKSDGWCVE